MTQKGSHTWDLHIRYYKCPKCELIVESRKKQPEIVCSHCGFHFGAHVTPQNQTEWDWDRSNPNQ